MSANKIRGISISTAGSLEVRFWRAKKGAVFGPHTAGMAGLLGLGGRHATGPTPAPNGKQNDEGHPKVESFPYVFALQVT